MKKIVIVMILIASSSAFALSNNDAQFWNTTSVDGEVFKKTTAKMEEEVRFGENMGGLIYQHTDICLGYKFVDWFSLIPCYRHIYEKRGGLWKVEPTPNINAVFELKRDLFKIVEKARFEYRSIQDAKNNYMYRNKLDLIFPIKLVGLDFSPFIADEIFIDLDDKKFTRNRLYAGFGTKLAGRASIDLYYLRQSTKNGGWTNFNVFGTGLKVKF